MVKMTDEFDVIVIGAGPPGENAAGRCADGGLSVAIVEERLVGGECSFYGCIPSKTLVRPGDIVAEARRAPGAAEAVSGPVDAEKAFAQRDYMTSDGSDRTQTPWLDSEGIELVRGHGRLAGERAVEVDLRDGGSRRLTARRAVVLAIGTSAIVPPIDGLREARPWTNVEATSAKEVPRRFLVLGGGPIGAELAQAFRRLGSEEVTVVEGSDRLLSREEPYAGDEVRAAFEAEGITVVTGAKMVSAVRRAEDDAITATLEDGRTFVGDEILVAVGRRPRTADAGLDTVGLADVAGKYLPVDDRLRVQGASGDGDWLYSVGDCNGLALLTHMGKYQGRLCGDVILGKDVKDVADHGIVPRVTFTDPQVAAVGLTEQQARDEGIDVRTIDYATGGVAGAYVRGNDIKGTCRWVVDQTSRTLVGATFVGPDIQELLHSATIAIAGKVTLDVLWHAVPAFPTVSEVWLRFLEAYGL
jgi:pyruvate/2-oxoglutarate dehydrogenase complex dihydrolipoamide dehydrogenase (E3) component